MSIQAECREAMHRLAARGGTFTEIDVANEASNDGWSAKNFKQAAQLAYNVLQGDYKKNKLVRFGPVDFNGVQDYARRGSKIIYADPIKGPSKLSTPNGEFPRLYVNKDTMMSAGRRAGTNRDDTKPWDGQVIRKQTAKGPPVDEAPLLARIAELEAQLRKASGDAVVQEPVDVPLAQLIDALVESPKFHEQIKTTVAEALIS